MNFTRNERLILWNQLEILKALYPDNQNQYNEHQKILENGYELFYEDIGQHIYATGLSAAACQEVIGILDMYRALHSSLGGAAHPDPWSTFRGFDGNLEVEQYGFARFLMDVQGKWPELANCPRNSHMPTLDKYRRMLAVWDSLGRIYQLAPQQIDQVVSA